MNILYLQETILTKFVVVIERQEKVKTFKRVYRKWSYIRKYFEKSLRRVSHRAAIQYLSNFCVDNEKFNISVVVLRPPELLLPLFSWCNKTPLQLSLKELLNSQLFIFRITQIGTFFVSCLSCLTAESMTYLSAPKDTSIGHYYQSN